MNGNEEKFEVKIREWKYSDSIYFCAWWENCEWIKYDCPWQKKGTISEERFFCELNKEKKTFLNNRLAISLKNDIPIGWVNYYTYPSVPHFCYVGISICDDNYLNKGIGKIALELWINLIIERKLYKKISAEIFSFNKRATRMVEKLGFKYEGCNKSIYFWDNKWIDLFSEWKELHH